MNTHEPDYPLCALRSGDGPDQQGALKNPLVLMSVPDREDIQRLAAEHHITALELLSYTIVHAKRK